VAPPAGTLRVGRYFMTLLALLAVIYGIVFWPNQRHTPKLGLDLVGGTQVIFTAKTEAGKTPSKASMNQAKQIMENRVNGSGVTESTVVIQGSNQIVISIPGSTNTDVAKLGQAAVLNFRGVVMPAVPVTHPTTAVQPAATASATNKPSGSTSGSKTPSTSTTPPANSKSSPSGTATGSAKNLVGPDEAGARPLAAPRAAPSSTGAKSTPAPTTPAASPSPSASAPPPPATADPFKGLTFPIPTSDTEFNKLTPTQQQQLQTAISNFDCTAAQDEPDLVKKDFIACDDGKTYGAQLAYLLGPVIVPGHEIKTAAAQAPNVSQGQTEWTVSLDLKSSGQTNWAKYTGAHNLGSAQASGGAVTQCGSSGTPCADYVAFTLDGNVISAPVNQEAINGGKTQISGNFTQKSSKQLADQLKYGALPLTFKNQEAQTVSATLGTSQLKAGLLAGGIGLALVVLYSLIYYRALGLVTIASLLVSGALTYGCLVVLGTQIGFTLSLAGIAGFIVAVGITADSFVVFFERIKDEVHEGRSMRVAIPRAWVRARRTVLSADTVSFLAAAILYYFAAGDVKGFAFTLGLSTVLDLVVVFLFTHPLISWLSRKKAFGSARFTGLNAVREGGVAPPAPEPAERNRTKPARTKAAQARTTSLTKQSKAPVALLERDEEPDEPVPVDDPVSVAEPESTRVDETSSAQPASGDEVADTDAPSDADGPSEPRRRSVPEPGSAAERAAARRAKMRARSDEKGNG
jgi:preprotein translocase subunit SecD